VLVVLFFIGKHNRIINFFIDRGNQCGLRKVTTPLIISLLLTRVYFARWVRWTKKCLFDCLLNQLGCEWLSYYLFGFFLFFSAGLLLTPTKLILILVIHISIYVFLILMNLLFHGLIYFLLDFSKHIIQQIIELFSYLCVITRHIGRGLCETLLQQLLGNLFHVLIILIDFLLFTNLSLFGFHVHKIPNALILHLLSCLLLLRHHLLSPSIIFLLRTLKLILNYNIC